MTAIAGVTVLTSILANYVNTVRIVALPRVFTY
jgi:hypothetical protein